VPKAVEKSHFAAQSVKSPGCDICLLRAGLVTAAEQWQWSSARAHLGGGPDPLLEMGPWQERCSSEPWRQYLRDGQAPGEVESLRQYTHTGPPLGSAEFIAGLEQSSARLLAARKGGRPKKRWPETRQLALEAMA
jgi:REP-associated tyrosine transposase